MTPLQRLDKLLNRQLFQHLAGQRDEVLSRITVVEAELCQPGCGINADDLSRLSGYVLTDLPGMTVLVNRRNNKCLNVAPQTRLNKSTFRSCVNIRHAHTCTSASPAVQRQSVN